MLSDNGLIVDKGYKPFTCHAELDSASPEWGWVKRHESSDFPLLKGVP